MMLRRLVACCALLSLAAAWPATAQDPAGVTPRGMTGQPERLLQPLNEVVDETARTTARPRVPLPSSARDAADQPSDPAWELADSVDVFQRLAPGDRFAVQLEAAAEALTALSPADPLTAQARQAVDRAPLWLQKTLEDQFSLMSAAQQDKWAPKILDAVDPYVDETAFLVAHISRQDLAHSSFREELIPATAEWAYEVDPSLDYVEVVDHGSAAEGGDYWTTLRYDVELDGTVSSVDYPRDMYYWWVLHPRGSDERPTYIDPVPCSGSGTPAPPPTGKFWRQWLFYGADTKYDGLCDADRDGTHEEPCPILQDVLGEASVLWAHKRNVNGAENGAVGIVNNWVRQSLGKFGDKDGCRPVQPVVIYYHQDGNCGEWGDLTLAAARAALIPTEHTSTRANDHVWNGFYDEQWGRWVQWEPVNNKIDSGYASWWSGRLAATHTDRGDGWGHTERTAQNGPTAELVVTVYDANHYPVDGAEVLLGSEYQDLPFVVDISVAHTDAAGEARFTLGDQRNFYVQVTTPWGTHPGSGWSQVVSNAQPDTVYEWSPPDFSGAVPRLDVSVASSSGTWDDFLLESSFDVEEGLVHGGAYSANIQYTKSHAGNLDFFVVDQDDWDLFTGGSAFEAFELVLDTPGEEMSFIPPEEGDWYVSWSNEAALDMSHVVRGDVRLYRNTGAVPPVTDLAVTKDAEQAALLDWEDVSGQNVDGYNVYRSTDPYDVGGDRTAAELDPFLLATTATSDYRDPDPVASGQCFFYSVRTRSSRGGISP
jgi:hypothetical protein